MRVAAKPAPNHVHAQSANAGADECDTHEVSEEHDERAHGASAKRGEDEHRAIGGTEHGSRSQCANVKAEQREDDSEKTIPGRPGDDAAENKKCERGELIRGRDQSRRHTILPGALPSPCAWSPRRRTRDRCRPALPLRCESRACRAASAA